MNPINLFCLTMKSGVTSKEYIDSKFISLTKALQAKVNVAGDKMAGNLNMNSNRVTNVGNPVDVHDCVTKNYLDTALSPINRSVQLKINVEGDSMLGDLDMNWFTVANLKFPLSPYDAANKLYVQILAEANEVNAKKLCKLGEVISILLSKYNNIQNKKRFFNIFNICDTHVFSVQKDF